MSDNKINVNEMKSEDIEKFASGISSGDVAKAEAAAPASGSHSFTLNGEIDPICPSFASVTREDVDYPEYTHFTYYSESVGCERGANILLPKDYNPEKKYPVLYLLHGIFGNEYSFCDDPTNGVRQIAANMATEGIIPELLIVCPNMYATADPDLVPGFTPHQVLPYDFFVNDLVGDLMPYVESHYSVLTGRENTLLAGFSMGGRETLYITLMHPELFGYVSSISAAPGLVPAVDWAMTHTGTLKEDEVRFKEEDILPDVFLVCCGTKDSVVGTFPVGYHDLFEKNGVSHSWYEIEGADHDSNAIRSGLYNLYKQFGYSLSQK